MNQVYEFGPFRLDARAGRVTRAHQEIHLTAKGYATLLFLVERAGSLVLKDDLLTHIWPEGFVEPANLTQTVYVLRKKLDDADAKLIETVPGRGYRFALPVRVIDDAELALTVSPGSRRVSAFAKYLWPVAAAILASTTLALHSSASTDVQVTPVSPEAHRDYILGRYYWSQRSKLTVYLGLRYFQAAASINPNYAQAYSGIADSYAIVSYYSKAGSGEQHRSLALARAAAQKAISLNPNLAEAHASLGFADNLSGAQYESEATQEFQRSIALDANYATAREWYSWFLFYHGNPKEALAQMEQARDLDPLSPIINFALANQLFFTRHFEEASEQWHASIAIDPSTEIGFYGAGLADEQLGNYQLAAQEFRHALSLSPKDPDTIGALAYALARLKEPNTARLLLAKITRMKPVPAYDIALVSDALGQRSQAIRWLQLARTYHDRNWNSFTMDPRMDNLRRAAAESVKDPDANA